LKDDDFGCQGSLCWRDTKVVVGGVVVVVDNVLVVVVKMLEKLSPVVPSKPKKQRPVQMKLALTFFGFVLSFVLNPTTPDC
jgi:hypothetical protein